MKAIGIDIGTTSVCGVVIDIENGRVVQSCTKNSAAFLKGCAEWEKIQSVDKIIDTATGILESFIDDDTAVIGVTGQMHGIVYIDASGNAVSPLYTWQDGRGNLPYKDTTYAKYLNSFSGYGNVTDFCNRELGIRPAEAVSYCTIQDYFVMRLCGLKRPIMHSSNAASLGCYNLIKNSFDYECSAETLADYHIAGKYRNIPVSAAIGDNQASVFSSLADENRILLNVGTGSQISIISDTPIEAENIETRPYFEDKFLVAGMVLCGGRAYSLLKNFYSEILGYVCNAADDAVYDIMNRMLKKADKTSICVDTRFAGTRSRADLTGSISGITTENFNPSELTLGVLEGMANELFELYKKMNTDKSGIVGSGNGVRKNPALAEALERRFGAKMIFPAHPEEASFGAALFGLISCNIFKNAKEAHELVKYTDR